MTRAIFPGTFDPVTRGHADLACRGAAIFDELIVAVGSNPAKRPLFSLAERIEMVRQELHGVPGIEVEPFEGLLVDFARRRGAHVILRGVRGMGDLEYEFQMAATNRTIAEDIETVFILPAPRYAWLNAKLIREIAMMGSKLDAFVSPQVAERLRQKIAESGDAERASS